MPLRHHSFKSILPHKATRCHCKRIEDMPLHGLIKALSSNAVNDLLKNGISLGGVRPLRTGGECDSSLHFIIRKTTRMSEYGSCRDEPCPVISINVWRVEIIVERTIKVEELVPAEVQGSVGYQRLRERISFKYGLWSERLTRHCVPQ